MRNIDSFLKQWSDIDKEYLIYGDDSISYRQAFELVKDFSTFLNCHNITYQNVAIFATNSAEYIISYFSILSSNSTCIPINVKLTDPEIDSEIDYSDCNWVLCETKYVERISNISNKIKVGIIEIKKDYQFNLVRWPGRILKRKNTSAVAVMLHTSGTTGNPKKVMLTHGNLSANTLSNIESLSLVQEDVVLISLPLFFGYCHTAQFLTHTRLGGTIVIYDQPIFTARYFCQLIQKHKVTCFTAVPTMLALLDNFKYIDRYNLSSLKYMCFGGGSISLETLKRLIQKLPKAGLVQTYGQTECSPRVSALLPKDSLSKIGSVGKPIPGVEVRIVNENGSSVESNQIGEITVKGENITPGYYKRKDETQRIFKGGWLYTGDLAQYDSDGYIYLVGRKKNTIISAGINIYPEEVENVIKHHCAIKEVIVKGESDELYGEIIVAQVTLQKQQTLTIDGLSQFLSDKLAKYKHPHKLVIRDYFEKTPTGKIARWKTKVD